MKQGRPAKGTSKRPLARIISKAMEIQADVIRSESAMIESACEVETLLNSILTGSTPASSQTAQVIEMLLTTANKDRATYNRLTNSLAKTLRQAAELMNEATNGKPV